MSGWNLDKMVWMVALDVKHMCLAKIDIRGGMVDFRACSLPKKGSVGNMNEHCLKSTHEEHPSNYKGVRREQLKVEDPVRIFTIESPTSKDTAI